MNLLTTPTRRDTIIIDGIEYQPINQFLKEIRLIPYLSSKENSIAVIDIDTVIENFKSGKIMMLELKTYLATPDHAETCTLNRVYQILKNNTLYQGLFLIQSEFDSPYNGYNNLYVWRWNTWQLIRGRVPGSDIFQFIKNILL